jgi:hypothetical protein
VSTFGVAAVLTIGAALTASFWLTLVLWIPGNLVSAFVRDPENEFAVMVLMTLVAATGVVFLFGTLVLGLPWYAALVAGALVGATSYPRRNPAVYDAF